MQKKQVIWWLEERRRNALRLASTKTGDDKVGWLEDAHYYFAAIALINRVPKLTRHPAQGKGVTCTT